MLKPALIHAIAGVNLRQAKLNAVHGNALEILTMRLRQSTFIPLA